jgi:hypothetical protein
MTKYAWGLQVAAYNALTTGLAPVPVYDEVPTGAAMPYVAIGDQTSAEAGDKVDLEGEEVTLTFHVWSRTAGKKQVKELSAKIKTALHEKTLTVTGADPVILSWQFSNDFVDADGITKHGVIRFGAVITTP